MSLCLIVVQLFVNDGRGGGEGEGNQAWAIGLRQAHTARENGQTQPRKIGLASFTAMTDTAVVLKLDRSVYAFASSCKLTLTHSWAVCVFARQVNHSLLPPTRGRANGIHES